MADGSASHIRSTPLPIPSRARIREALTSASSLSEASKALGVTANRIRFYCTEIEDDDVRAAYRGCVARGKFHRSSVPPAPLSPKWAVFAWLKKPDDVAWEWVRVWSVDEPTAEEAIATALRVTQQKTIKVEEIR